MACQALRFARWPMLAHAGIRSLTDLADWFERDVASVPGWDQGAAALRDALHAAGKTFRALRA